MPNLVSFIDSTDYYNVDIEHHYKFVDCKINDDNFKLKLSKIVINGIDAYLYLLTDKNDKHLSLVRLVEKIVSNKIYHQINKSFSIEVQKGYGQVLYKHIFDYNPVDIISDHINTLPGSFNLWKRLLSQLTTYRLDTKNNRSYKVDAINDEFLIWGVEDDFLEVIKQTQWEAVVVENFDDEYYDDEFDDGINYLTLNDAIERTILSDYIVKALKNKKKLKNRADMLLLIKK